MFTQARLKLTGWYLLIIMIISLSFSAFVYKSAVMEFQRRLNSIETRLNLQGSALNMPRGQARVFSQDVEAIENRLFLTLVYMNGVILVFSGLAGYFLAGRTLSPIEEAMEDQKRFVTDASHELKTPLTALKTTIEVALRDKKLKLKDSKAVLKDSLEEVDNLSKLTNDLLVLARYQQSGNVLIKNKINTKEVIKTAFKNVAPLVKNKNIKVTKNIKAIKINANKESIEQLFTIMLDNAVKYTPKNGKINISSKINNKQAVFTIKDTGIGIEKKDISSIFDRFYRADTSRRNTKTSGFGLGLSMAKKIVELHSGHINVDSKPGKGSTFTLRFPL